MWILKNLVTFTQPLGFAWLCLSLWVLWQIRQSRWKTLVLPGLAWLALTVFSCTPMNSWLLVGLENEFPAVKVEALAQADAIVCLGGGAEPSLLEPMGVNFNQSVDRVTTALGLLTQGKAPVLVITGGGYEQQGVVYSEADAAVAYFQKTLRLPMNLLSLGVCADTHDEAVKMAALAKEKGWRSVHLVTSASHLPRAVAVFEKQGLQVTPVPCDYQSSFNRINDMHWLHLPSTGSLVHFGTWSHEIIGLWVYRLRGWL